MERGFYNEDFDLEKLLRQRSNQFRMYPSDKVWKNIRRTIHHARYIYGMALLILIGSGTYLGFNNDLFAPNNAVVNIATPLTVTRGSDLLTGKPLAATYPNPVLIGQLEPETPAKQNNTTIRVSTYNSLQDSNPTPLIAANLLQPPAPQAVSAVITNTNSASTETPQTGTGFTERSQSEQQTATERGTAEMIPTEEASPEPLQLSADGREQAMADQQQINWLQEYAVYELSRPATKKLSWQFYATPTMNYRKIIGNQMVNISPEVASVPLALTIQGNINNLLNHKPAMGFELGTGMLYAVSKKIAVKAGAQFNYARYDIQAYSSSAAERATISISTVRGSEALTSFTNIRNLGGTGVKDLKNEYFQVSLPVGMEYTLLGNRRLQLAVAGTFQPTYMLNHNNYLITTDYKNYTREPSLLRRFNMNTSVEAFMAYKVGGMKIQLGPQFRYQLYSSFISSYPIREHLKEFGFKLGITKEIR